MPDRETSQPTKSRSKFQLLQTFTWFYSNGKICRHPIHLSVKYYRRGIEVQIYLLLNSFYCSIVGTYSCLQNIE